MPEDSIILYPSNWLYNAGVIGFLRVVEKACSESIVKNWIQTDGTVKIDIDIFKNTTIDNKEISIPICMKYLIDYLVNDNDVNEWRSKKDKQGNSYEEKYKDITAQLGDFGYKYIQAGNKLFASKTPYQNLVQLSEWKSLEFATLIGKLKEYPKIESEITCGLCTNNKVLKPRPDSKLENRLFVFQEPHMRLLGPSIGKFPNAFWNLNDSVLICPLCAYLIIHHHIPFESTRTQNGQIFINAPSFKIM